MNVCVFDATMVQRVYIECDAIIYLDYRGVLLQYSTQLSRPSRGREMTTCQLEHTELGELSLTISCM